MANRTKDRKQVNLDLPPAVIDKAKAVAAAQGVSLTAWVTGAITREIARAEKRKIPRDSG